MIVEGLVGLPAEKSSKEGNLSAILPVVLRGDGRGDGRLSGGGGKRSKTITTIKVSTVL